MQESLQSLTSLIDREIRRIVDDWLSPADYYTWNITELDVAEIESEVRGSAIDDLEALASRDPAALGGEEYVLATYASFKAVLHHRIANAIYRCEALDLDTRRLTANGIANQSKTETSIDIHPGASIGRRFVIDHGARTRIGETTIGDNCYFLQGIVIGETCRTGEACCVSDGVILGARGIAGNPTGKRHPTIGSSVEIAGFARVFGPVTIDDYVKVGPHCVIDFDVVNPNKSHPDVSERWLRVSIINQLQICAPVAGDRIVIYGVVPLPPDRLEVYGSGLTGCHASFVGEDHSLLDGLRVDQVTEFEDRISLCVGIDPDVLITSSRHTILRLATQVDSVYVIASTAVSGLLRAALRAHGGRQ